MLKTVVFEALGTMPPIANGIRNRSKSLSF